MKKFLAVFNARNKEFLLDRANLIWSFLFPIVLVLGFSFAFSGNTKNIFKVGVIGGIEKDNDFFNTKYIQFIEYDSQEKALVKIRHHQIDILIDINKKNYWINVESSNGYLVEKLFLITPINKDYLKQNISGRAISYAEWTIPGLLGMAIMNGSLFGIGNVIIRYRRNGVLKRLKATPLSSFDFITAQIFSRLIIVLGINAIVFVAFNLFLHFIIVGSFLNILLIALLTTFCYITLGLLVASRTKSEELGSGIINAVSLPMIIFNGVWISLEGSPKIIQDISNLFPLTLFVESIRKIMFDGAGIIDILPNIIFLSVLSIIFLVLSSAIFKWDN